ncbi:MAG TPA: TIR domain-containing protein [Candidatus Saccharimonadales bacterium]|nr:TIR domain-containing protein [Candidatus Saccharimonadales bacterium]
MSLTTSRKIFLSYKYRDTNVQELSEYLPDEDTDYMHTPRHYVDYIIDLIGSDHIYKGEKSDDDASHLSDDSIDSRLKAKIFDSSITLVLLSPNMWEKNKLIKNQWIPQEISYSLRTKTRNGVVSKHNGILAVALPDYYGSYDYAVIKKPCGVTQWQTYSYFPIIGNNMFNRKIKNQEPCSGCFSNHHYGYNHSYIHPVKWDDFIINHNLFIDLVAGHRDNIDNFEVVKSL